MKARILCYALCGMLFFTAAELFSDGSYTVENIQFIPQVYYVGDRVELRVLVRSSGVEITPPLSFPAITWGEFHDARVLPRQGLTEIRIQFTAYETGGQAIPNLSCGDVVLQGLSVSVRSLTEEDSGLREPAPPHGPLLLPSTRLFIAIAAGLFITLPLGAIACNLWLRPWIKKFIKRYSERKPYRQLKKRLAALKNEAAETDARFFYIGLLDAVKLYMHARCETGCVALTTRELDAYFERAFGGGNDKDILLDIFRFGDEVKFGGRHSPREKQLRDAALAGEITSRFETKAGRHAHV